MINEKVNIKEKKTGEKKKANSIRTNPKNMFQSKHPREPQSQGRYKQNLMT